MKYGMDTLNWLHRAERMTGGISAWQSGEMYEKSYPEVTGYLIPTLIDYDALPLAKRCADWLMEVQNPDGSWAGLDGIHHTFDTAAVIEGLEALYKHTNDGIYLEALRRGLEFIEKQKYHQGLYRRSPAQNDTANYLLRVNGLTGLRPFLYTLYDGMIRSHYVAYALEGLWNLEYYDVVRAELAKVKTLASGLIPFWIDGSWKASEKDDICATCQFAILLEKAGMDSGSLVEAARRQVRDNGGVPQSTDDNRQIAWGAKFYLDMEYLIR